MDTLVSKVIAEIEAQNKNFPVRGMPSGFQNFDAVTRGFQRGHLYVLAGQPNFHKTSFLINLTFNMGMFFHYPVKFFSLSDSEEDLLKRLLFTLTDCNSKLFPFLKLDVGEYARIIRAGERFKKEKNIQFVCNKNLGIEEIEEHCQAINGKGIAFLDYLEMLSPENFGKNLKLLKNIATKCRIPIIAVHEIKSEEYFDKTALLRNYVDSIFLLKEITTDIFENEEMREVLEIEFFKPYGCKVNLFINEYSCRMYNSLEEIMEDSSFGNNTNTTC
ncbi:MAG: replicative DNA helicase [Solidesulfovibrio magneticus str. Maddingley MBC34]|uniref:Replicative DNA helicase n=1 Tax=Solidesulfovibrio magneticus str. Maddingley MBC34 TaxID=1206767 RepID=K6GU61_9BACT|nr:MAG: replicative DNA helicase [Solidesulfovibrio magneticus str. Maddingley MBC34]